MFKKVLIANRGEIAIRIIRSLKEMGIKTVAVYSEADINSLHVSIADEAICIGPAASKLSYLYIPNIISAAEVTECDAIHPGYGFLAENRSFAKICGEHELKFIGPTPEAMEMLGDKSIARKLMIKAKVPVVPGSPPLENFEDAVKWSKEIEFPIMIKASGGGGGRGMRIVMKSEDLEQAYNSTKRESENAFGNDEIFMEKYVGDARHIEVQIISDEHGNYIHLGERDCSIQKRHQKLIEEAPSFSLDDETKNKLFEVAINAARTVNYTNAGTVEFLFDNTTNQFYFMEMNARIQVEHPVTEMVTGIDIIQEQINIAAGKSLSIEQKDIRINGHAIECRINCEDSENNFAPSCGKINKFISPGGFGVRIDSNLYTGYDIPPFYDSMVGKIIVWGKNRREAIKRMDRVLGETKIEGIKTTIPFHKKIMNNEKFISGNINTVFIEEFLKENE